MKRCDKITISASSINLFKYVRITFPLNGFFHLVNPFCKNHKMILIRKEIPWHPWHIKREVRRPVAIKDQFTLYNIVERSYDQILSRD